MCFCNVTTSCPPPKTNMLQYFSECVQGYSQNVCEQMPLPASDPISSNNCLFQGVVCACVHLCACIHVCISAINLYLFNSWAKLVSKYLKHHLRTSHWPCGLCNSNQAPPSPTPPHSGPVTQFCYSLCWPPILLQKQQQQNLSEPTEPHLGHKIYDLPPVSFAWTECPFSAGAFCFMCLDYLYHHKDVKNWAYMKMSCWNIWPWFNWKPASIQLTAKVLKRWLAQSIFVHIHWILNQLLCIFCISWTTRFVILHGKIPPTEHLVTVRHCYCQYTISHFICIRSGYY